MEIVTLRTLKQLLFMVGRRQTPTSSATSASENGASGGIVTRATFIKFKHYNSSKEVLCIVGRVYSFMSSTTTGFVYVRWMWTDLLLLAVDSGLLTLLRWR